MVAFSAPEESIITLKLHLRDIGYTDIGINGIFDMETQAIIKDIQARHGIPVDGFVGALTQIVLYNETRSLTIPHLWESDRLPVDAAADLPDGKNKAGGNS
jgi:general secretion pathway protein A